MPTRRPVGSPLAARVRRAPRSTPRCGWHAGAFLPDDDGEWATRERQIIARTIARARLIGAEAALAAGDPTGAAALAERALDHDPYDEQALRALMSAHAAAGRPASALAVYSRCRARLGEDLGVDPAPETAALHTAIVRGERPPAPPAAVNIEVAPLVGRVAELAVLDRESALAAGGSSRAVIVEGESGIGKTALVNAWSHSISGDALVLAGRCDELGRELPLQPVLDALAAHLRQAGSEEATPRPRGRGRAARPVARRRPDDAGRNEAGSDHGRRHGGRPGSTVRRAARCGRAGRWTASGGRHRRRRAPRRTKYRVVAGVRRATGRRSLGRRHPAVRASRSDVAS